MELIHSAPPLRYLLPTTFCKFNSTRREPRKTDTLVFQALLRVPCAVMRSKPSTFFGIPVFSFFAVLLELNQICKIWLKRKPHHVVLMQKGSYLPWQLLGGGLNGGQRRRLLWSALDCHCTLLIVDVWITEVSRNCRKNILSSTVQYSTVNITVKFSVNIICRKGRNTVVHHVLFVVDLTVANPSKGRFFKPAPGGQIVPQGVRVKRGVRQPVRRTRKWRPGTQALREIRNLMRTTNLCISRLPFMW